MLARMRGLGRSRKGPGGAIEGQPRIIFACRSIAQGIAVRIAERVRRNHIAEAGSHRRILVRYPIVNHRGRVVAIAVIVRHRHGRLDEGKIIQEITVTMPPVD